MSASADDWPQWRGPDRDGISQETGLLKAWPEGGPKRVWHVKDLGGGYGSPSIVGERIYVVANEGLEAESVKALATQDGHTLWSTRIGKVGNPDQRPNYPAARSTPTVDGEMIYALGSDGDLACLEAATGNLRWQKNLRTEFGGEPGEWAYSESPLVDGDVVVCAPGGAEATIVALDKRSGDVIWKSPVPGGDPAGYASAVVTDAGGVKQYVAFLANGLVGVDAKTGEFLWRYERTKGRMGMSSLTPVVSDGLVYSGAGRVGGGSVRLSNQQGTVTADEVYFDTKLPTALGGAVLVADSLYGSGGQALVCADFQTGELKWTQRTAPASLCYADGRLYVHEESGEVALVEATPEEYREHGRFTPPDRPEERAIPEEKAWAYPAIADGRLYIRDSDSLWCFDIRATDESQ
jgi:outer membrane protein assembly factor BamB